MFCFILLLFYFIFFVLSFHFVDFAGSNQDFAGHHLQPPMTHTPPPSFTAAIHQLVQFISSPKKPHHFTTIPQSHPPLPKPPRAVPPNQKPETQINPPTSITKSTTIPNLPQPWPLPSHSTKTPHRKLHTSQPHLILSSIQHTKPASSPLHPKTIVSTSSRPNHLTQITTPNPPNPHHHHKSVPFTVKPNKSATNHHPQPNPSSSAPNLQIHKTNTSTNSSNLSMPSSIYSQGRNEGIKSKFN